MKPLICLPTSTPSSDNGKKPEPVADDFPPDPLLPPGTFILPIPAGDGALKRIRIGMSSKSNGSEQVQPSPDKSAHRAESKSRKRAAQVNSWLPPGWRVEEKVRTSGATAGKVDKYYYEPVRGRKFRSKPEVLYYLEHGTKKGRKVHLDRIKGQGSSSTGSKKGKEPPLVPPLYLGFDENVPEKVSWEWMTSGGEKAWIPFIEDEKVPDSVRRNWSTAFTLITRKRK